jgi:hypothetical protein
MRTAVTTQFFGLGVQFQSFTQSATTKFQTAVKAVTVASQFQVRLLQRPEFQTNFRVVLQVVPTAFNPSKIATGNLTVRGWLSALGGSDAGDIGGAMITTARSKCLTRDQKSSNFGHGKILSWG